MEVINLFGAPGSGKSTTMFGLTYKMKIAGESVESTPEFYKELILEGTENSRFGGQLYVLGEQNRRLDRLVNHNDFAITDCPLPLIGFYSPEDYIKDFDNFVINLFNNYNNRNYLIIRNHEFENRKRIHSEQESIEIERQLPDYLDKKNIDFTTIEQTETMSLVDCIYNDMYQNNRLQNNRNQKSEPSLDEDGLDMG